MRIVTYGGATSLDMFIAGPGGSMDWLVWTADAQKIMSDYWPTIDTILMGRKTYQGTVDGGGGGSGNDPQMHTYVFSRTMKQPPAKEVTVVSEDAGGFVRALKARRGKGICLMGGGELARSLFEADVIDEVGVNIHPVLLGSGTPLVPGLSKPMSLELISARPIKGGCVYALYRVKR